MSRRTQYAYVAAVLTLLVGLVGLLNPVVLASFLGLDLVEPRALSEMRATYGGLFTVLGGLMLWALPGRPRQVAWLKTAALILSSVAVVRGLSILIDAVATPVNVGIFAFEAFIALAAVLAAYEDLEYHSYKTRRGEAAEPKQPLARYERDSAANPERLAEDDRSVG